MKKFDIVRVFDERKPLPSFPFWIIEGKVIDVKQTGGIIHREKGDKDGS